MCSPPPPAAMSLSDSDDDLLPRSKQQRTGAAAAALSDSDDDAFADVFRPKSKQATQNRGSHADDDDDSYSAPSRSHICDECEGSFAEAVFCGECSMTYCLPCDQRYHSGSEDVRVHYRSALHGTVPQAIAKQVAAEQAEEEREAARQRQRDEESLQRQADERAARRRLHDSTAGFSDDDEDRAAAAARDAKPKDQWQQVGSQAANEARRMFSPSDAHAAPRGSMPPPAGPLSPSAASAATAWRPQSPLASRSAASLAAAAYPVSGPARNATGVSFALDPFGSTGPPLQGSAQQRNRSAAASAGSRGSRPASAGPRPMVVLQSTRPSSATSAASRGRVVSNPTRVGITSNDPSLPGKTRFNRNMTIRSTSGSAAAIHQRLPPRDGGFAGLKARTGSGAHSNPAVHTWSAESADASTVALHSSMLALKAEVASLAEQKHLYKTAVLKRQKALKEIGRIAATLAKQPNAEPPANQGHGSQAFASTVVSTAGGGELGEKVATLRTSVEILRLEIEDLTAKLVATRSQGAARSSVVREQQALERERAELARAVSIAAASRDLDAFKRSQLLADLRFALSEMQSALDSKKKETTHAKMAAMQMENQTQSMKAEYERIQGEVDQWAAKQVR